MSAHHPIKDRKFLLNQLRSGLGFINQSIHVARVMERNQLAEHLSAAARLINGAIIEAETTSAEGQLTCHGYTGTLPVGAVPAAGDRAPISVPLDATVAAPI